MENDRMALRTETAKLTTDTWYCKSCKTIQASYKVAGCHDLFVSEHQKAGIICEGSHKRI